MTRQIIVPEGKALFFPVLSIFGDNTGCPTSNNPPLTAPELAAQVLDTWNATTPATHCSIDGVPVNGLENPLDSPYHTQTPPFAYTLAAHHNLLATVFGEPCVPDGTTVSPAIAEGIVLMVTPFAPGTSHTIQFGEVPGPLAKPFLVPDVLYNIVVTPNTSSAPAN